MHWYTKLILFLGLWIAVLVLATVSSMYKSDSSVQGYVVWGMPQYLKFSLAPSSEWSNTIPQPRYFLPEGYRVTFPYFITAALLAIPLSLLLTAIAIATVERKCTIVDAHRSDSRGSLHWPVKIPAALFLVGLALLFRAMAVQYSTAGSRNHDLRRRCRCYGVVHP